MKVTLVWTDAPGATTGAAWVNNLDLVVEAGGRRYLGNVFGGAFSRSGGEADTRNNVESVYLPAGVADRFAVTVKGLKIAGDGVPATATRPTRTSPWWSRTPTTSRRRCSRTNRPRSAIPGRVATATRCSSPTRRSTSARPCETWAAPGPRA